MDSSIDYTILHIPDEEGYEDIITVANGPIHKHTYIFMHGLNEDANFYLTKIVGHD